MALESDDGALELLHEEVKARLIQQRENSRAVDTKGAVLVTLVLASVPLGLWSAWSWYIVPARVLAVLAVVAAVRTIGVRSTWATPVPRALIERYGSAGKQEILEALVSAKVAVFERNAVLNARKARTWRVSVGLLLASAAAFALGSWLGVAL